MTIVVPRLDRESASEQIVRLVSADVEAITAVMPTIAAEVTYSPVGGARVEETELRALRIALLALAREHGMPGPLDRGMVFEGRAARMLRELLPMTPHEASHEEVWSYLTCCWLLDIAVWRFGHEADERRFIGNVNRNTFRRMWWRAEILGEDIDLDRLGEDELVNIMERPTIASDRRLARAIASEFLDRVDRDEAAERMLLMREAMKRVLRLTPFVAFPVLDDVQLGALVADAFGAAAAGLAGETVAVTPQVATTPPEAAEGVVVIPRLTIATGSETTDTVPDRTVVQDFDTVSQAALDIAKRTGRVTNINLREVAAITSDEAREVFQALMADGLLVRRGVKRGTHYVLPEPADSSDVAAKPTPPIPAPTPLGAASTAPTRRANDTPLRRLLRRGR